MSYEINVALNGRHYFATHSRSIVTPDKAVTIFMDLRKRFPADEGYSISISYKPGISYHTYDITTESHADIKEMVAELSKGQ